MGSAVVLPLRGELPRSGGNDDFSGACRSITPRSTAGSRNTPLSWTIKHGGTGRYLTGKLVPGGWMRPISGSAAGGATSDLAITAGGQTLDFYLSSKRNVAAAKCFLAKAVRSRQDNKQDELLTPSKTKVRKPRAGVRM